MLAYTLRRLVLLLNMFLLLSILAFLIGELGVDGRVDLSWTLAGDYVAWLWQVIQGDFGQSLLTGQPVAELLRQYFPPTLQLILCALLLSVLVGIPLGVLAALFKGSNLERPIQLLTFVGLSVPHFWWGYLLILVLSVTLGVLPMSGQLSLRYELVPITGFSLLDTLALPAEIRRAAFVDALRHLVLPTIVVATAPAAVITQAMRSALSDVLTQGYIKAARAKGLSTWRILWRHGVRNTGFHVLHTIGLQLNSLLTTALVTETVFGWPGLGNWLIAAVAQRDFPAIQGGLLAISSLIIVAGILFDLLYMLSNPISRKGLYATA